MEIYKGKVYMREFDSFDGHYYNESPDVTNEKENLSDVLEKYIGKDVTIVIFDKQLEKKDRPLTDGEKLMLNEEYHKRDNWR